MGKKRKRPPRIKEKVEMRTKEERKAEAHKIIKTLTELQLTTKYEKVCQLMVMLKEYVEKGERLEVHLPFPEIDRRIEGVLAIHKREEVWLRLTKLN
tara:strand:- start:179 stop:469 length:291 start_codon:yes stop_codon:yes gene_type:complete